MIAGHLGPGLAISLLTFNRSSTAGLTAPRSPLNQRNAVAKANRSASELEVTLSNYGAVALLAISSELAASRPAAQ